jgi:uncharacterized repeat protein (TIGR03803 family)
MRVLVVALGLMLAGRVTAQTYTTLYNFSGGMDGGSPASVLRISGNILYGTTFGGGSAGYGTVFSLNIDGTGYRVLHSFAGGSEGAGPWAALTLSGVTLYGTTTEGGNGVGTVFKVNTDGTGFATIYQFSAGTLIGSDGTGEVGPNYVNADGACPKAGLVLSGNTLYGSTPTGGYSGDGTVFKVNTDGTGFSTLHAFSYNSIMSTFGNYDGSDPTGGTLALYGKTLYGTCRVGGSNTVGTIFAVSVDGGDVTLHNFGGIDGGFPEAGVYLSGNTLYGIMSVEGTAFSINTDGTGYTLLPPQRSLTDLIASNTTVFGGTGLSLLGLVASTNALYGAGPFGGNFGGGAVFSISFPPQLSIVPSAANTILTWPTNYAGFDYGGYTLQSSTNLASSVWSTNLPSPTIINGLNTVTNPISGTQRFYRLSQ